MLRRPWRDIPDPLCQPGMPREEQDLRVEQLLPHSLGRIGSVPANSRRGPLSDSPVRGSPCRPESRPASPLHAAMTIPDAVDGSPASQDSREDEWMRRGVASVRVAFFLVTVDDRGGRGQFFRCEAAEALSIARAPGDRHRRSLAVPPGNDLLPMQARCSRTPPASIAILMITCIWWRVRRNLSSCASARTELILGSSSRSSLWAAGRAAAPSNESRTQSGGKKRTRASTSMALSQCCNCIHAHLHLARPAC